jgi:hypothetical protein
MTTGNLRDLGYLAEMTSFSLPGYSACKYIVRGFSFYLLSSLGPMANIVSRP